MATSAKALLLAVQLATKADIPTLRTVVSRHRIRVELVLRILLSYLPESLDASEYVPFLKDLISENILDINDSKSAAENSTAALDELSEEEARRKVKKLHLLPLAYTDAPADAPPIVLFLIHRALRVDESTGLLSQIPELVTPFLHHSPYLRAWTISSVLPLLRMNYEYYPENSITTTISEFEGLDDRAGVALLLSRTGKKDNIDTDQDTTVGRDLKGLVGPWMYGDTRWKRRKLSSSGEQSVAPLDETPVENQKYIGWEEAFRWITRQARTSWKTAVRAIEQWDGPGDIDTGGYEEGAMSLGLNEDDQAHLEQRYARSVLAAAYLISEESVDALNGVNRILTRLTTLMDKDRIPDLQTAAALLSPVSGIESDIISSQSATFLRNQLLDDQNVLTRPNDASIKLLHALLISAFLCTRVGSHASIRRVGELALLQDLNDQKYEFTKLMIRVSNGPKGDDKYWVRMRNELLWLRCWGAEELSEGANGEGVDIEKGRGIFGQLPKEYVEAEILKALLANTRYTLARSIYETSSDRPLSKKLLEETIISAAMNAYDNATNANRTRGGVKKCDDILHAFPNTLGDSIEIDQLEHLVKVTASVGQYKLVFRQGEPFKPVTMRVHGDPISIIGKILDQNPNSYTKIGDFIDMGKDMVMAGLTVRSTDGRTTMTPTDIPEQLCIAEKRVVGMCIDAALVEDDFETAYSYVVTRLQRIGTSARARSPGLEKNTGLVAEIPPKVMDDWSWRAALQAGKYRRTGKTVVPSHLGNASGNPEIRHLEQRIECLSHAMRLAPKATLMEIVNVYRRCEEELDAATKREEEQEAAWDAQADDQVMPGGFAATPMKKAATSRNNTRGSEEAPMSLFDLSRASVARAQSGFASLSMLRGNGTQQSRPISSESAENSRVSTPDSGAQRTRKRDQLRDAAVGGLASGVGWLIGAKPGTPVGRNDGDDHN